MSVRLSSPASSAEDAPPDDERIDDRGADRVSEVSEHDEAHPFPTQPVVESEGPPSGLEDAAWAEEMAEQVAALWEGRPGAVPFELALTTAARARRR